MGSGKFRSICIAFDISTASVNVTDFSTACSCQTRRRSLSTSSAFRGYVFITSSTEAEDSESVETPESREIITAYFHHRVDGFLLVTITKPCPGLAANPDNGLQVYHQVAVITGYCPTSSTQKSGENLFLAVNMALISSTAVYAHIGIFAIEPATGRNLAHSQDTLQHGHDVIFKKA